MDEAVEAEERGGGGGAFGDSGSASRRYNLSVSLNVQNLLNHTNLGIRSVNLTSPLFGQSNTTPADSGFGGAIKQPATGVWTSVAICVLILAADLRG